MTLTRNFKETIQARVEQDPSLREALLKEGVEAMLVGDVDAGKTILRDYINATIGFEELGGLTDKPHVHVQPRGNPQARNLFEIIGCLLKREGLQFELRVVQ